MIGASLIPRLLAEGHDVTVLSRPGSANRERLDPVARDITIAEVELTDPRGVRRIVQETAPEVVFHMATTPFNPPDIAAQEHMTVNVAGTANVLEALRAVGGARFIRIGSGAEYGAGSDHDETHPRRPTTAFGVSKLCASKVTRALGEIYGLHVTELLFFTPFGPWERPARLIPHTILSALRGECVKLSSGEQRRDYLYVDDVVEAMLLVATTPPRAGAVFNICAGKSVRIAEVAAQVLELMGNPVPLECGALSTRKDEIWDCSGNNSRARTELGWSPRTDLTSGLEKTIRWFRENQDVACRLN